MLTAIKPLVVVLGVPFALLTSPRSTRRPYSQDIEAMKEVLNKFDETELSFLD